MLLKVLATSFTIGAGGNGGVFGTLFTGARCGFAFSHSVNLLGNEHLDEVNFVVNGKAAMMSGIKHSPL
jgi:chloride channel protein, CIC family